MNNIMRDNYTTAIVEAMKNANITLTLENWPCTVAVLGICATVGFVAWVNSESTTNEAHLKCVA